MSPFAVVGVYDTIQAQFFPEYNVPIVGELLPGWPWEIWAIVVLVALWLLTLEGAYRTAGRKQEAQQELGRTAHETDAPKSQLDQLSLVINAINKARELQPKGNETTVYITAANRLFGIYPEELKGILLKLQEDGALELRTFPEWLLSNTPFTKEVLNEQVMASLHPQKKHFVVALKDKFEKLTKSTN